MGCCASKPKVLKGNEKSVPIPPSRQPKAPIEADKKVEAEADLNPHRNKRRSLSNLLEEEMKMEVKTPTRLTRSTSMEHVTQELSNTEKLKEVNVVTKEETKEPMTGVEETGNRNSESVQYIEARSVHDMVAEIEKLNKCKSNVVTPKKPPEWMYTPFSVPVALRKIELGRSAEPRPTPKAATDTERPKGANVVIEDPVKLFEHNYEPYIMIEPESVPEIPKEGNVIMNLKFEEIAYEIQQLYKPEMMDCFPINIKSGKSEPEASTDTAKLKDVNAIMNQKIEEPSREIKQIYKPDPAGIAPGNTESIKPKKLEPAPGAAAADSEKLRETNVSINQEPAKPTKVFEYVHKAEEVAIA